MPGPISLAVIRDYFAHLGGYRADEQETLQTTMELQRFLDRHSPSRLTNLPIEIFLNIASYLPYRDLKALRRASKGLRRVLTFREISVLRRPLLYDEMTRTCHSCLVFKSTPMELMRVAIYSKGYHICANMRCEECFADQFGFTPGEIVATGTGSEVSICPWCNRPVQMQYYRGHLVGLEGHIARHSYGWPTFHPNCADTYENSARKLLFWVRIPRYVLSVGIGALAISYGKVLGGSGIILGPGIVSYYSCLLYEKPYLKRGNKENKLLTLFL